MFASYVLLNGLVILKHIIHGMRLIEDSDVVMLLRVQHERHVSE